MHEPTDKPRGWLRPPWAEGYDRTGLKADLFAGFTVAVLLVPQAMAYAMLAGLPPHVGLYACLAPLLVYAAFGTSRQLAVGPVAIDSLLVAASLGVLAEAGSDEFIALATVLAVMVGGMQILMSVLSIGKLLDLLSRAMLAGFTSAVAIIIAASQLKYLLGVDVPRSTRVFEVLASTAHVITEVHVTTFVLSVATITTLVLLKRFAPRVPRALVVVTLGTALVAGLGVDALGTAVVGHVPAGLPTPKIPDFSIDRLGQLVGAALALSLIGVIETISVARALQRLTPSRINTSKEVFAIGASNVVGGFLRGYPVAAGFSRSAVNYQAGAKSPLSGLFTAIIVATTLVFFTPLFEELPVAVLASVIVAAVASLVDHAEARRLWREDRHEFALFAITAATTLLLGVQLGILVGIVVSVADRLRRREGRIDVENPHSSKDASAHEISGDR